MAIRIFKAVIGVFSFRKAELAELEIQQQMDEQDAEPLTPPCVVSKAGILHLHQSGIDCGDLEDNKTTEAR